MTASAVTGRAGGAVRPLMSARAVPRRQGGAVVAELVIVTPLLMLLVLLVVQFALWQHAQHIAEAAAQRGSEVARLEGGSDDQGYAVAQSATAQLGANLLLHPSVSVTRAANLVRVEVSGTAEAVLPFLALPVRCRVRAGGALHRRLPWVREFSGLVGR